MIYILDKMLALLIMATFITACGDGGGGASSTKNEAPYVGNVAVTDNNGGVVIVGDVLTVKYTYTDNEGDAEGVSIFQWLRDGVAMSSETSSSYTLVNADIGKTITFKITPIALTGTIAGNIITSSGITIGNSAPSASNVNISYSSVVIGTLITGSYIYADIDGDRQASSAYRWLRNGTAISGATSLSYRLVNADSGQLITFEITPGAVSGSATGNPVTSSPMMPKNAVNVAWNLNPETAVNRSGGGYKVYYSTTSGFVPGDGGVTVVDVPYVSGVTAPTSVQIIFVPGTYYLRVAAYSSLNAPGTSGGSTSTATTQTTLTVP